MCIHNHQAAQIWIKFITQIFSCKLCKSTLNECRHRNRNVDIETNFYWATSNKRCYITIKRNTSISWWSPAYLWCNTVNTHINTHILWINMYIIYIYIYIYICIYIYIYTWCNHHWRILWSSYRKSAWVGFEPMTTEFRSNLPNIKSPAFFPNVWLKWLFQKRRNIKRTLNIIQ